MRNSYFCCVNGLFCYLSMQQIKYLFTHCFIHFLYFSFLYDFISYFFLDFAITHFLTKLRSFICCHLIGNDFPSRSDLSHNDPHNDLHALIVYGIYHTRDHQNLRGFPQYLNSPAYGDFHNYAEMF